MKYLNSRVGESKESVSNLIDIYKLYNPLFSLEFLTPFLFLGLVFAFKNQTIRKYILWFFGSLIFFILYVKKPGTHIYNIVIPAIILSSLGIAGVTNLLNFKIKYLNLGTKSMFLAPIGLFLGFFWYQSYLLFTDYTVEYPWQIEKIHKWSAPQEIPTKPLPLFGFPRKRYWVEINEFVNKENSKNNEDYGYTTNEEISTSRFYMDADNRRENGFYYIVIKRPLSFIHDWNGYRHTKKTKVKTITNFKGEEVVKIYKVFKKNEIN